MLHLVVLLVWTLQCETLYIVANNTALFKVTQHELKVVQSGLLNVDHIIVSDNWIYWSELGNGRGSISKCHLNNENTELLITNLIHVSGFTIAHPNIYYLEMGDPSISPLPRLSVFSLNSRKSRVLLEIRRSILPRSVAVDVKTGDVFYGTNNGDVMRFEQYTQTLDILVKSTIWPTGLFFQDQCLYIYNGIQLQTYNTSTKTITTVPQAWRVNYITGPTLKYLQVVWTGLKNVSIGVGDDKVAFKWDQTEIQSVAVSTPKQVLAQCQSTNCEICLPRHDTSYCTCQTGVNKAEGADKCPQGPDKFILFTQATAISLLSLHSSSSPLVKVKVKYHWDDWVMMDVVYNKDTMFWVEGLLLHHEVLQTRIMKRSLFSKSGDAIVYEGPRIIQSISLDNINSLIYWLDITANTITVATIECSQVHCVKSIIVKEGLEGSSGLNVMPNSGYMVYVSKDDSVVRRKLNGQDPIIIFPKDILNITSITVDHSKEMVYISSSLDSIIIRIPLGGGIQVSVYKQRKQFNPISMVVFNTTLYVINDIGRTLLKISLITKQPEVVLGRLPGLKHVTASPLINVEGVCSVNNGGCEQFCFALPLTQDPPLGAESALSITKECGCADGFRLRPDGLTCQDPPLLYVSMGGIVQSLHPFSPSALQSVKIVAHDTLANITAVEFLWSKQYLIWIDKSALTISFSPIKHSQEGFSHTNLVTDGLYDPRDIAVDWISNTVYWVDSASDCISLVSLDGAIRKIIVRHAGKPSAITLDPTQGLMFWIGWESDGAVIRRANMDGSGVITIVSRNPKWPVDITWDSHKKRVVWVDARYKVVVSCNSDGSEIQYMVGTHYMHYPLSLAVWYDHVYWADKNIQAVYIAKSKNRDNVELISASLVHITDMVLAHENKQIGSNNCSRNNGGCQYTCIPNSLSSSSCLCPRMTELASDLHTCQPLPQQVVGVGVSPHLFSVGRYGMQLNRQQIKAASSMSVHYEHQSLYWLDMDTIKMVYLNGTGLRTVFRSTYGATRLALDWLGGNIYWTEAATRSIKCVTLSGAYTKVIIRSQSIPAFVMIDPPANILFWFECGDKVKLLRSKLTGSDKTEVLEITSCPLSADLGRSDSSVFWVNQSFFLQSYNYKRNVKRSITQLSKQNMTIIVWVEENIFHFTPDTQTLVSINRLMPVGINVGNATKFAAYSPLDSGRSNCQIDNGGCTHFCFPGNEKHVCACPAKYELLGDNTTCTRPRSDCEVGEFRCKTGACIKKSLTCDYYHDCLDGSDETTEMCGWCPPDMFACGKTCISSSLFCNGDKDCPRGEDEDYSICRPCKSGYICKSSGMCLPWTLKCNGVQECEMGDDEQRCARKVMECGQNEWKCKDGSCIWNTWRCDGTKDCRDGEDETNCPSCNKDDFECGPQDCISNKYVCDKKMHCINGADEQNCPERCRPGQRQCESGMCITEQRWCDRYIDCPDKSDERGCNYTMFDVPPDEDSSTPIGPVIGVVAAALALTGLAVYLIYKMNILPKFKNKYKDLQMNSDKTIKTNVCRTNTCSEPDTTLCSSECSSGCDGNHIEMKIRDPFTNDTLTCSSLSDLLRPINGYIDPYQRYGMDPVKSMTDISDRAAPNPSEASGGYSSGPSSSRRSRAPPPFINLVNQIWVEEEDHFNSVSDYEQNTNFRNYRNHGNYGNSERNYGNSDHVYNEDYLNSDVESMSDVAMSDKGFGGFSRPQGSPVTEKSFERTFLARPCSPITTEEEE